MFNPGTPIVHSRHGAGVVLEPRQMSYGGEQKQYFCMEKADSHTLVMIPMDSLDSEEIREAHSDFALVERVMRAEPEALDDNHRVRQSAIEQIIRTRKLRLLSGALRDLCWREKIHKLTTADTRLRNQLQTIISNELSLAPEIPQENARTRLSVIVSQAILSHFEDQAPAGV